VKESGHRLIGSSGERVKVMETKLEIRNSKTQLASWLPIFDEPMDR